MYATLLAWPRGEVTIRSLGTGLRLYEGQVRDVRLLGSREKVQWSHENEGLRVKLPAKAPCESAYCLRIERA